MQPEANSRETSNTFSTDYSRTYNNTGRSISVAKVCDQVVIHAGEPPTHIETAQAVKVGDAVEIKLGYDGTTYTEFRGYVKRLNYKVPLEIECEDEYYKLRFVNCVYSKKETTLKECLNFI